ncbi:MAG: ABC transporter ATP-binding protein [Planctomycetaceae bacterium]
MIAIRDLQFAWTDGPFRLCIPTLEIARGEAAVLAGPSGCGKTTLLNLISGILPPAAGLVEVNGTDIARLSDAERRLFRLKNIGLVFQDFQLLDYLDVLGNVLLPCRIQPSVRLTPALRERGLTLLQQVGLADFSQRSVTRLSQGERQRVALCRALLLNPQLLLADEPTGNLDPHNSRRMVELLLQESRRSGATLIMVTHDHSLLPMFDRTLPFEQYLAGKNAGDAGASQ